MLYIRKNKAVPTTFYLRYYSYQDRFFPVTALHSILVYLWTRECRPVVYPCALTMQPECAAYQSPLNFIPGP